MCHLEGRMGSSMHTSCMKASHGYQTFWLVKRSQKSYCYGQFPIFKPWGPKQAHLRAKSGCKGAIHLQLVWTLSSLG